MGSALGMEDTGGNQADKILRPGRGYTAAHQQNARTSDAEEKTKAGKMDRKRGWCFRALKEVGE